MRRAEPRERRHEIDAAGIVTVAASAATSLRCSPPPTNRPNQSTAPPVIVMLPSSAYEVRPAKRPRDRGRRQTVRASESAPAVTVISDEPVP